MHMYVFYGAEEIELTTEDDGTELTEEEDEDIEDITDELTDDVLADDSGVLEEAEDSTGGERREDADETAMVGFGMLRRGEPRFGIHFHSGLLKWALDPNVRIWKSARAVSSRETQWCGIRRLLSICSGKR